MPFLVDTNVLLRSIQSSHPMQLVSIRTLEILLGSVDPAYIAMQNVAEFWNAATRPIEYNGLGFTVERANAEVGRLEDFFQITCESLDSYREWRKLLLAGRIHGAQVHDARLAAIMKVNKISRIVTFNVQDFQRFSDIEAIHPETIVEAFQG